MAMNKKSNFTIKFPDDKLGHPVDTLTKAEFVFEGEGKEKEKKKPAQTPDLKLKNFRIERKLIEDFEFLCKIRYIDFTEAITNFIRSEVEENEDTIAKLKKSKTKL